MRLAAVAVASLLRLLHLAAPGAGTKVTIVRKEGLLTAGPLHGNGAVLLSIDAAARPRRGPAAPDRDAQTSGEAESAARRPGGPNGTGGLGEGSSAARPSPSPRAEGRELRSPSRAGGAGGARGRPRGNKTAVEKFEKEVLQQLEKPVLTHLVGEVLGKGPSQLPVRRVGALQIYLCVGVLVLVCSCGYVYCALNGTHPEALYGYTQTGVKRVCPSSDISSFLQAYNQAPHKLDIMGNFLATRNVLEAISIQKTVTWDGWEELAQCVRRRLRELGFSGRVDALLECDEQIVVFWNHPWSNFLRSWIVQLVLYLSVAGGLLYYPYMAFRAKTLPVQLQFRVRIEPSQYWDLIRVGVCADKGFVAR